MSHPLDEFFSPRGAQKYIISALRDRGNDPQTCRDLLRIAKDEHSARREVIAVQMLAGIEASPIYHKPAEAIKKAVRMADALIAELDKPTQEPETK